VRATAAFRSRTARIRGRARIGSPVQRRPFVRIAALIRSRVITGVGSGIRSSVHASIRLFLQGDAVALAAFAAVRALDALAGIACAASIAANGPHRAVNPLAGIQGAISINAHLPGLAVTPGAQAIDTGAFRAYLIGTAIRTGYRQTIPFVAP